VPLVVYHYPACSTCKKALAWFAAEGLAIEKIHIVDAPPAAAQIEAAWRASGEKIEAFFNTSGESYRAGDFKSRLPAMSDAEKIAALAADGKLIRRPLVLDAGPKGAVRRATVGFREPRFAEVWLEKKG
jgi:arsenate reductase